MNLSRLKYVWLILPFLAIGCEDDDVNADRMALSHKTYGFPVNGGEFTMMVSSTVPYSVTSEGGWLVMTGEADNRYSYKADENTSYDMRTALILVKAGNKSSADTVHVYQVGKEGLFLDEAERSKSIGLEGGEIEVNVNFTNAAFRIKPEVEWITAVTTKATGLEQGTITLRVEANPDYSERSGKVVIASKDGLFTDTVTITQSQKLGVLLDKKSFSVVSEGEILTVGYRQNVGRATAIIADEYKSWVTVVPEARSLTRDTLYLEIAENEVPQERVAIIPIVFDQYTDTLTITQGAAVPKIEENADGSFTVYSTCPLETFKEALNNAAEGAVFILKEDCVFDLGTKFSVTKGITIKGESADKRAIFKYTNGELKVTEDCGDIIFENLEIYATNGYVLDMPGASTANITALLFKNCYVKNAKSALFRTKATVGGIGMLELNGSIFENIGDASNDQGFISVAADCKGYVMNFNLVNSTFIGCSNLRPKDFIGITKNMASPFTLTVKNNTFYNCANSKSLIVLKKENAAFATIEVSENIIVCGTGNVKGINLNGGTAVELTISKNCVPVDNTLSNFDDGELITLDPQFRDVVNGDFSVMNETVKAAGLGDPRWLK